MTIYSATLRTTAFWIPGRTASYGLENFRYLPDRSRLSRLAADTLRAGRFVLRPSPARRFLYAADKSAGAGAQHRPAAGDRAVLRDADRQRAGLEEFLIIRFVVCLAFEAGWRAADGLVQRRAVARRHPDRVVAMAPVRDADPAHRAAIAGRRTEGSGRDRTARGRRRRSSTSRCRIWRGPSPW